MLPGQQYVKKHSKRVDIGSGRDRLALELLGCRKFGGHGANAVNREGRSLLCRTLCFEQLGNAEVQKLYLAVMANQNVRRLQVPMHDQVRVRFRNCAQHIKKEPNTNRDRERLPVAITVNVQTFNVIE